MQTIEREFDLARQGEKRGGTDLARDAAMEGDLVTVEGELMAVDGELAAAASMPSSSLSDSI
jgi:hypothetical protein